MANLIFAEAGTDSTQDFSFYSSTTGTVASDSTVSKTGSRSIKLSSGIPAATAYALRSNTLSDAGRRISFWFRFDTLPAVNSQFAYLLTSGGSALLSIILTTGGLLRLTPVGATTVDGTTVMVVNTWYRIAISYTITSTTVFKFVGFVDGVLNVTCTAGTMSSVVTSDFRVNLQSTAGDNRMFWFDNIYIDDGSDYSDPGDVRVTSKRPNANGTANNLTTQVGSGGSGYGTGHSPQVNEQPLSTTNGWSKAVSAATTEEYNVEAVGTGDVNITGASILGVMGWVYCKSTVAENGQIIVQNATSNISITTSAAMFTKIGTATYPVGTGTDIGLITSATVATVSIFECGIVVAYLPRVAPYKTIVNQAVKRASTY